MGEDCMDLMMKQALADLRQTGMKGLTKEIASGYKGSRISVASSG
jgi:hypothetical protein